MKDEIGEQVDWGGGEEQAGEVEEAEKEEGDGVEEGERGEGGGGEGEGRSKTPEGEVGGEEGELGDAGEGIQATEAGGSNSFPFSAPLINCNRREKSAVKHKYRVGGQQLGKSLFITQNVIITYFRSLSTCPELLRTHKGPPFVFSSK